MKNASTVLIFSALILSGNPKWVNEMQRWPFPAHPFSKKSKCIITFNVRIKYREGKRHGGGTTRFFCSTVITEVVTVFLFLETNEI